MGRIKLLNIHLIKCNKPSTGICQEKNYGSPFLVNALYLVKIMDTQAKNQRKACLLKIILANMM
ncbi:hypothetical protein CEE39_10020 [bacterium (candidate division B38) B3_B38]|nr:MAG: hypothetical protein CEE39_10020 [bacterium (candidate division B38) B3_B38]